jgi:hypothetical protein
MMTRADQPMFRVSHSGEGIGRDAGLGRMAHGEE